MRSTIAVAMLLAGGTGGLAQEAVPALRPTQVAPAPSTLPKQNEDALNRQVALDKRMDARTRRAIGSVCQGCSGSAQRPARGWIGGGETREAPIADPAEAPLD